MNTEAGDDMTTIVSGAPVLRRERATILCCDDERLVRWSLREHLTREGFDVIEAADGQEALELYESRRPDLILLDIKTPRMDGIECLRELRTREYDVPVIMLSALGSVEPVQEATRLGASSYLTKPFQLRAVTDEIRSALERHRRSRTVSTPGPQTAGYHEIIGGSPAMQKVFETLRRLEGVDAPTVLITGESGTGKDMIARAIHARGVRSTGPFVEVDCTAIPETLMESTLFGHEKGAFTDARATRRGLFEAANGGVVFLDEIGEMAPAMQAKLLRALQNRRFKRVGGNDDIRFDAAVVAATNRDIKTEVEAGRFREDLYYRLAVVEIRVPPLRARGDDVAMLIDGLVRNLNRELGRDVRGVTEEAMARLRSYRWPGNVRELRNVVEKLVLFADKPIVGVDELPPNIRFTTGSSIGGCPFALPSEGIVLDDVVRGLLTQALERANWNQSEAARMLGISRFSLRGKMKKYGLL